MYKNDKIEDFLEKLSSSSSMPGGGVASSLTAASGISLTLMVCNLTIGKEKYKEYEELVIKVKNDAEDLKKKFLELMDKDAETFEIMEKVFAMPNVTEDEKKKKKEKMQEACKVCCQVPREMMENVLKGLEITSSIVGKSNQSAKSDLMVAKKLLCVSAEGAWENISINLHYIDDDKFKREYFAFCERFFNAIKKFI